MQGGIEYFFLFFFYSLGMTCLWVELLTSQLIPLDGSILFCLFVDFPTLTVVTKAPVQPLWAMQ